MYRNFKELEAEYSRAYEDKAYDKALSILENGIKELNKEEYDNNYFTINCDKAIICSKNNMIDTVIEIIDDLVNKKFTFPIQLSTFEKLKDNESYIRIKEKNKELINELQKNSKMKYSVCLPENYDDSIKHPAVFIMHGDGPGESIKSISRYWKPDVFTDNNFIFAYMQSSQIFCHEGYGWLMDADKARTDIRACYEEIKGLYNMDEECVLIGGFSGGAITSIDIAMTDTIPLKGFICLCPELKPASLTKKNVADATKRGVRGVFMEGEQVMPVQDEEDMIKAFSDAGLPYQYYVNKCIGHWYPEDLNSKLKSALEFITKK